MKEGWEYKEIGEVCEVTDYVANGSFATLRENVQYKSEPDYAILIRLADYTNNFDSSKFVYINEHAYNFLAKSKLYGGEIIMSNVGSLGKEFICPKLDRPMSLAPNSIVIRTPFNKFFYYCFSSTFLQGRIKGISSQTALPKFNKTQFKKLVIPIPSPSEQQHIVEELDLLSSIIEKKKAQLNELDNLAQSLFYEMFGDPIENAKGWHLTFLQDVCTKINDGTHNSPTNEEVGDYMYVTAKNIKKDGIVLDNITYINKDIHKLIYERCNPEYGDVLYIKDGATTGIATINTLHEEFSLLSSVALLKPKNTIVNQYLKAVLNMPSMYNVIRSGMGGAAITRLTIAKINKIRIPLPPIDLQNQFAERVQTIEHHKELIKQSIKEVETLFNSRMDYYFN